MGFFKKVFGPKEIVVDPADLTLPEQIPTSVAGLTLTKKQGEQSVDIPIVGESYRAANVAAVAMAADGKQFDIYLVAEPTNQYDKNAVAVFAANLMIGYIAKPDNKQWVKWVNEATANRELIWGRARAVSREGTANTGVFGFVYMPRVGKDIEGLIAKKLTPSALDKAIEKIVDLYNGADEPETVAQLRAMCKKCVTVATPIAAHAKWVEENPDGESAEAWVQVASLCEDIFQNAADAAYATDAGDVDPVGTLSELAETLSETIRRDV